MFLQESGDNIRSKGERNTTVILAPACDDQLACTDDDEGNDNDYISNGIAFRREQGGIPVMSLSGSDHSKSQRRPQSGICTVLAKPTHRNGAGGTWEVSQD
jgi:hypothetical protein